MISFKNNINNLYNEWINTEFFNPVEHEIKPSLAGYYIYTLSYNSNNNKVRSRQLLHDDHVKILKAFNTLKDLYK